LAIIQAAGYAETFKTPAAQTFACRWTFFPFLPNSSGGALLHMFLG